MVLEERLQSLKVEQPKLVGGFNPFEKYESKWKSSLNKG